MGKASLNFTETYNRLLDKRVYTPQEALPIIREVSKRVEWERMETHTHRQDNFYALAPASFDIETYSFHDVLGRKSACLVCWQFCLDGYVIMGRTWEEYTRFTIQLADVLGLDANHKLVVYVHNLSYEFQFMLKRFQWDSEFFFAMEDRKPAKATANGLEYRCSLIATNQSLASVGKDLRTYPMEKAVGDWDYTLPRHSKTPLTDSEIWYAAQDVRTVVAWEMEQIEAEGGSVKSIPLTKTGHVRRYCRNRCLPSAKERKADKRKARWYKSIVAMRKATQLTPETYESAHLAFQGGFTHANTYKVGRVIENVTSMDFTSSYPAVMVCEVYPMSAPMKTKITDMDEFNQIMSIYCGYGYIRIRGLRPRVHQDHILSESRCQKTVNPITENGRIVFADEIITCLTNVDVEQMEHFYEWDSIDFGDWWKMECGFLPSPLVECILDWYENKTKLKGIPEMEPEYMQGKAMLNSVYGMAVTDILRDTSKVIDGVWHTENADVQETIDKYNKDGKRFLSYLWGLFVTAYARRNLYTGILELGNDYIYADTDSVKFTNPDKHQAYFDAYNAAIQVKMSKALDWHGFPVERACPKTVKGVSKPLGVWDYDGTYSRFKTLGAKRYLVEDAETGEFHITVAGLGKKAGLEYLLDTYGAEGIFDAFQNGLSVPADRTGKLDHCYIDERREGILTDYTGVEAEYCELSCVNLEPIGFSMTLAREFLDRIEQAKTLTQYV